MRKSVFPRPEGEETPTRKATVLVPRWVIVSLVILLLVGLLFLILHHTGNGMGQMPMSFIADGGYVR